MANNLGKETRLNRLFSNQSGRIVAVMLDHFIARGNINGIENIQGVIDSIIDGGPNSITIQKGIAKKCFEKHAGRGTSLILKASSPSPYSNGRVSVLADVEEAVMCGADAISIGCTLGGEYQSEGMEKAAKIVKEAEKWGIPVVGHFYPNGSSIATIDREKINNVIYAARVGAEIGLDVMKVHHDGNLKELEKIVKSVPAKIVLAGGSPDKSIANCFQMAKNVVDAGAAGIAFGRVVYQSQNIGAFVKALKLIVHDNKSVEEAMNYYNSCIAQ